MKKKFLTDSFAYTLAQLVLRLRGLIVLPLFARTAGAEGYAVFLQLTLATTLLTPLVGLKLETAAVRFLSSEDGKSYQFKGKFYGAFALITLAGFVTTILLATFSEIGSIILFGSG